MSDIKKKVMVTGAGGYLGGVTALELESYGYEVVRVSHHPIEKFDAIAIDLTDKSELSKLHVIKNMDAVFHFACILPGRMNDDEMLYANQTITENIVEWTCEKNIPHFILASGCNVYGLSSKPCYETAALDPHNAYALSKLTSEHIVLQAALNRTIKVVLLRIAAPYGPMLKAITVIKNFVNCVKTGRPIMLKGNGMRSQHFIFETDVAYACHLALSKNAEGIFNVSGSEPVNMKQLAEKIITIAGAKTEIRFEGDDEQEFFRGNYPTDKAFKSFGYLPQVMLEDGLKRTFFS